jgi:hypothetical protein
MQQHRCRVSRIYQLWQQLLIIFKRARIYVLRRINVHDWRGLWIDLHLHSSKTLLAIRLATFEHTDRLFVLLFRLPFLAPTRYTHRRHVAYSTIVGLKHSTRRVTTVLVHRRSSTHQLRRTLTSLMLLLWRNFCFIVIIRLWMLRMCNTCNTFTSICRDTTPHAAICEIYGDTAADFCPAGYSGAACDGWWIYRINCFVLF